MGTAWWGQSVGGRVGGWVVREQRARCRKLGGGSQDGCGSDSWSRMGEREVC
jgi:hypothetical protein